MFRIWCTVAGGITGYREAWLKDKGEIYETESEEDANERVRSLRDLTRDGTKCSFSYSVVNMES